MDEADTSVAWQILAGDWPDSRISPGLYRTVHSSCCFLQSSHEDIDGLQKVNTMIWHLSCRPGIASIPPHPSGVLFLVNRICRGNVRLQLLN